MSRSKTVKHYFDEWKSQVNELELIQLLNKIKEEENSKQELNLKDLQLKIEETLWSPVLNKKDTLKLFNIAPANYLTKKEEERTALEEQKIRVQAKVLALKPLEDVLVFFEEATEKQHMQNMLNLGWEVQQFPALFILAIINLFYEAQYDVTEKKEIKYSNLFWIIVSKIEAQNSFLTYQARVQAFKKDEDYTEIETPKPLIYTLARKFIEVADEANFIKIEKKGLIRRISLAEDVENYLKITPLIRSNAKLPMLVEPLPFKYEDLITRRNITGGYLTSNKEWFSDFSKLLLNTEKGTSLKLSPANIEIVNYLQKQPLKINNAFFEKILGLTAAELLEEAEIDLTAIDDLLLLARAKKQVKNFELSSLKNKKNVVDEFLYILYLAEFFKNKTIYLLWDIDGRGRMAYLL